MEAYLYATLAERDISTSRILFWPDTGYPASEIWILGIRMVLISGIRMGIGNGRISGPTLISTFCKNIAFSFWGFENEDLKIKVVYLIKSEAKRS